MPVECAVPPCRARLRSLEVAERWHQVLGFELRLWENAGRGRGIPRLRVASFLAGEVSLVVALGLASA